MNAKAVCRIVTRFCVQHPCIVEIDGEDRVFAEVHELLLELVRQGCCSDADIKRWANEAAEITL